MLLNLNTLAYSNRQTVSPHVAPIYLKHALVEGNVRYMRYEVSFLLIPSDRL